MVLASVVVVGASVVVVATVVLVVLVVVLAWGRVVLVRGGSGEVMDTGGASVIGGALVRVVRRAVAGGPTVVGSRENVAGAAGSDVASVVVRSTAAPSTVGAGRSSEVFVGAVASSVLD